MGCIKNCFRQNFLIISKFKMTLIIMLHIPFLLVLNAQTDTAENILYRETEWVIADLLNSKSTNIEISGNPGIVNSPYGPAVKFNGLDDALFLKDMPLKSLSGFTVEMIFRPASDSTFEQRILHLGEVSGDRMLLEIRAVGDQWYFDGYVASGNNKKALIDERFIHPLEQWYHVAFIVGPNSLSTYVNGNLELQEDFEYMPSEGGSSSIGVRLNRRSWFKGSIYKIKVTPKLLAPNGFIDF